MEGGDYEVTALDIHPTRTVQRATLWAHVFLLGYDKSYNRALIAVDSLSPCDDIHLFVNVFPRVGDGEKGGTRVRIEKSENVLEIIQLQTKTHLRPDWLVHTCQGCRRKETKAPMKLPEVGHIFPCHSRRIPLLNWGPISGAGRVKKARANTSWDAVFQDTGRVSRSRSQHKEERERMTLRIASGPPYDVEP